MNINKSIKFFLALLIFSISLTAQEAPAPEGRVFEILNKKIKPGEKKKLQLNMTESFLSSDVQTPLWVINGKEDGPVLCITGGIHGDELNGVEIVRRIVAKYNPEDIRGTIVAIPVVNIQGFRRSSRYLPDRKDLNRYFPGTPTGNTGSRIAYQIFSKVISKCQMLVDFHTGTFHRSNFSQVRGNLKDERVKEMAVHFSVPIVVHNIGPRGTLRRAAMDTGIPAIIFEGGHPMRFQEKHIAQGVRALENMMAHFNMIKLDEPVKKCSFIFNSSAWVRSDNGGIMLTQVRLGEMVEKDSILAHIIDPVTNNKVFLKSPYKGRIIGMAYSQVVLPGYLTFHIGIESTSIAEVGSAANGAEKATEEPVYEGSPDMGERPE